jgi:hypothetical protein
MEFRWQTSRMLPLMHLQSLILLIERKRRLLWHLPGLCVRMGSAEYRFPAWNSVFRGCHAVLRRGIAISGAVTAFSGAVTAISGALTAFSGAVTAFF